MFILIFGGKGTGKTGWQDVSAHLSWRSKASQTAENAPKPMLRWMGYLGFLAGSVTHVEGSGSHQVRPDAARDALYLHQVCARTYARDSGKGKIHHRSALWPGIVVISADFENEVTILGIKKRRIRREEIRFKRSLGNTGRVMHSRGFIE